MNRIGNEIKGRVSIEWKDPECDPVAAIRQIQAEIEWLVQQLLELKVGEIPNPKKKAVQ